MASRSPLEPSKASRSAKGAAFRALRSRRSDPPAGAPRKGSVAKHEIYGIPRTKLSTRSSARKISGAFFRSFCFVDFFSRRPSAEVKRQIQNELRTSLTNEGIVRNPKGSSTVLTRRLLEVRLVTFQGRNASQGSSPCSQPLGLEVVDFDQPDAGRVISIAHKRGVSPGREGGDNRRFEIVRRRNGRLDFLLLS
jgi:hypothetical protein